MPARYRLLVFDWDGTLMDSTGDIVASMQAAFDNADLEPPSADAVRNVIGLSLSEAVGALLPGNDAHLLDAVAARYRTLYVQSTRGAGRLFPGVRESLCELRADGYLLAIATGKGRSGLWRALRESATGDLFHATRTADEAFSKPHPQMLLDLLDELEVEPADALMVGDSALDLEMARNAGVSAAAVCCGVHGAERLLEFSPQVCLDDVSALPGWLRGGVRG